MLNKKERGLIMKFQVPQLIENYDGDYTTLIDKLCDEYRNLYTELSYAKMGKVVFKNKRGKIIGLQG